MGLSTKHQKLLEETRGLDAELLARLGVETCKKFSGEWIAIPFVKGGKVVNHKYRTIAGDKRFSQDRDADKVFWNIDVLADGTLAELPLIITEGEFDAMAAIMAGFPRTLSVPDGAPPEQLGKDDAGRKYSYVADAAPLLKDVKEIILCTDTDGPGVNLLHDLAIRLGKHRCKWVTYPVCKDPAKHNGAREVGERLKDLNEVLIEYGARGVTETINRAQWMKVSGVFRMSELPPRNQAKAYSTGIATMDKHFKIRLGDFTVITGIPGHGKTTLVNEICGRAALQYGWTSAFASFEQEPQVDHKRNLRTFFNKKPARFQSDAEIAKADEWIERYFSFIVPDEDEDADLAWVLERAATTVVQHDAKIVVIDPWNEMDHVRPPDMSLTEYTGYAIKQFKKFAKRFGVHLIVCAHPTKMARDKNGNLPCPTLYDISDSAHWANKPDVGMVVFRETETTTLIRIQKSRYHDEIGRPGSLEAHFLEDMARFEIVDKDALRLSDFHGSEG